MSTTSRRIVVKCLNCDTPYNYDIPETLPKNPRLWCKKCNKQFSVKGQIASSKTSTPTNLQKNIRSSQPNAPLEHTFIDDPNELLYSVAMRELNKPDPDPRWANILISCKKENISNKNESVDQFKQLTTKVLVNLLNKNSQGELS